MPKRVMPKTVSRKVIKKPLFVTKDDRLVRLVARLADEYAVPEWYVPTLCADNPELLKGTGFTVNQITGPVTGRAHSMNREFLDRIKQRYNL